MGLFLQKTNIIRDYLEDILEEPAPRMFWPREIWGKHADELAAFKVPPEPVTAYCRRFSRCRPNLQCGRSGTSTARTCYSVLLEAPCQIGCPISLSFRLRGAESRQTDELVPSRFIAS